MLWMPVTRGRGAIELIFRHSINAALQLAKKSKSNTKLD
jgi:hypothetical protein